MGNFSTVDCQERLDTFNENFDVLSGITFNVELQCKCEDRHDLIGDILFTPQPYPKFTGFPIYANSAAARPMGDITRSVEDGQEWLYKGDALVNVSYSTRVQDIFSDSIEPLIEYGTLDHKNFKWINGGVKMGLVEGEAPPFITRSLNFVRTRYKLATIPPVCFSLCGYVNSDAVESEQLGMTFPPETLMFQPLNMSQTMSTMSVSGWTIALKFAYKASGWNTFWRARTQAYESLYISNSLVAYKQYPSASFAELLA